MNTSKLGVVWQQRLADQQASGLNKTAYCRQHKLDYDQFQYRYRQSKLSPTTKELIPVSVSSVEPPTPQAHCVVEYAHGVRLHIQSKEALALLPQLLMRPSH